MTSRHPVASRVLAVFLWTSTSFLCHWSAKRFLKKWDSETDVHNSFISAFALTSVQCLMCFLLVDLSSMVKPEQVSRKIFWIKIVTHALATFFTNYSMTFIVASSTFTIKLLEPITSGLAQKFFQKDVIPTSAFFSLPIMLYGALQFTYDPAHAHVFHGGLILAFMSNITLAARNIAISTEHKSSIAPNVRKSNTILNVAVCLIALLGSTKVAETNNLVFAGSTLLLLLISVSGIFHVVYSYVSTNVILKMTTVFNHSILNMCKRLLVVLGLYMVGSRKASFNNWLGLLTCAFGFAIYTYVKYVSSGTDASSGRSLSIKGILKKLSYLLLPVCLVLVCVPIVSQNNKYWPRVVLFSTNDISHAQLPQNLTPARSINADNFDRKFNTVHPLASKPENINNVAQFLDTIPINDENYHRKFDSLHKLALEPDNINNVSQSLETREEIIYEAQRIHYSFFSKILAPYKYVMLFDAAIHENKGDPAITIGELILIEKLNKTLVYYCNYNLCSKDNIEKASNLSKKYTPENLIVLLHGGGNLVGWVMNDHLRKRIFSIFKGFRFMLFPQSVFMSGGDAHLAFCENLYRNQNNFTMVLRDRHSLELARKHFSGKPTLLMSPDMAFEIGARNRFMKPFYDILWIRRTDMEKVGGKVPTLPKNITVRIDDWLRWGTPRSDMNMENVYLLLNNGFVFLQRGRVVITDRLHGHILCVLLDIPHVVINNKWNKVGNYHNTWTRSHKKTLVADNEAHALELAISLLDKYSDILPETVPFMDVKEILP